MRGKYSEYITDTPIFFGYEFHDRHISDVLRTLGKRCEDIGSTLVETRYRKDRPAMSYFMDEFIGYDLSHEQVRDAKECRLCKGRLQRGERLLLQTERERGECSRHRGNTACHERTNAKSEKTINIDMETSKTIKPEENAEASEMLGYIMGQLKHNGGKWT